MEWLRDNTLSVFTVIEEKTESIKPSEPVAASHPGAIRQPARLALIL